MTKAHVDTINEENWNLHGGIMGMADLHFGDSLSWTVMFVLLVTALASSFIYGILFNLYLHPLAHVPGPKLAAATYLYQTYHSLHGGKSRYYLKIAEMHQKYGPIVRVTPDEVQLSDPDDYDLLHSLKTRFPKHAPTYSALGAGYSTFTSGPNEMHRPRRARLDPFFSRRKVLTLESIVQHRAQRLISIVKQRLAKNEPVDLHHAFRSISVDVITDYAFGESYELLEQPDLGKEFFDLTNGIGPSWWVFQQFPLIQKFALSLPESWAMVMDDSLRHILTLMQQSKAQVLAVKAKIDRGEKVERGIFETLLTPEEGYVVPSPDQLKEESYALLNAASDTTGNAMTVAAYNVTKNLDIYRNLSKELAETFPDESKDLDFLTLEKLPYLTGVIKEGLRLSFPVPGRLPRVVQEPGLTTHNTFIPAGSVVSSSMYMIHTSEKYFPDHSKFAPERWLDSVESRRLDKAFVPFSRGPRSCAGINLAYCELYVTIGTLFRRFANLKSNDLSPEDLIYNDYFSAQSPLDAKKFHVIPPAI